MLNLIGSVEGCQVVIVDDEIDTAGSITQAAEVCLAERRDRGLRHLHPPGPLRPGHRAPAGEPDPRGRRHQQHRACPPEKRIDKLTVLSIAPLLGETIQRIHTGTSVGAAYRAAGAVSLR